MTFEFVSFNRFENALYGRIRFAMFSINSEKFENEIIESIEFLKMQTPHAPFANSIFFDQKMEKIAIPVTGPKRALTQISKDYIVSDIEFRELESYQFAAIPPKKLEQEHFFDQLNGFLEENPRLNEKKLLLELNSKYLALHFFL